LHHAFTAGTLSSNQQNKHMHRKWYEKMFSGQLVSSLAWCDNDCADTGVRLGSECVKIENLNLMPLFGLKTDA
jgi:hypothetical protein